MPGSSAEEGRLASGSAAWLHTCFASGVRSPVTLLRDLTCLAGSGLRESSGGGRHCGMANVRGKNVPDPCLWARSPPRFWLF